jgi:hypothetical protein
MSINNEPAEGTVSTEPDEHTPAPIKMGEREIRAFTCTHEDDGFDSRYIRLSYYPEESVAQVEVTSTDWDSISYEVIDWGNELEMARVYNHMIEPYIDENGNPVRGDS